jgi:hypothetical protein
MVYFSENSGDLSGTVKGEVFLDELSFSRKSVPWSESFVKSVLMLVITVMNYKSS